MTGILLVSIYNIHWDWLGPKLELLGSIYIYMYILICRFLNWFYAKKNDKCWSYDRDCVKQFCGQLQTTLNIEHKCHPLPSTGPSNMGVGQHHGTSWHQNSWSSWYNGWRLTHPSEKYEFVSWDDDIPNIWKKTCLKPPTRIGITHSAGTISGIPS